MHAKSLQSCPTLRDSIDCSPPGSSVHGILQVRILEWVTVPSFRGPSWPRDRTRDSYVSCIGTDRFFTTSTTWGAPPFCISLICLSQINCCCLTSKLYMWMPSRVLFITFIHTLTSSLSTPCPHPSTHQKVSSSQYSKDQTCNREDFKCHEEMVFNNNKSKNDIILFSIILNISDSIKKKTSICATMV